jgi:hypothetical protein
MRSAPNTLPLGVAVKEIRMNRALPGLIVGLFADYRRPSREPLYSQKITITVD